MYTPEGTDLGAALLKVPAVGDAAEALLEVLALNLWTKLKPILCSMG